LPAEKHPARGRRCKSRFAAARFTSERPDPPDRWRARRSAAMFASGK